MSLAGRAGANGTGGALRGFHRPRRWVAGWIALMALVAVGSLLPSAELPRPLFPGFDKVQHFVGYAVLSGYAVLLFQRMRAQALAALGVLLLGIAIELAQSHLTLTRTGSIADALTNALGILAGLAVAATPLADALQRLDARLARSDRVGRS